LLPEALSPALFSLSHLPQDTSSKQKEYHMSAIKNLHSFASFTDLLSAGTKDYIHIRIQQRICRKTLTTVQGVTDDYEKKKSVKVSKKKLACDGTVLKHSEYGEVTQLQGD
jgi:translation initiation factor 1